MAAIIVIPARLASTRLPNKPLLARTGKYLIQHVYERACQCRQASAVIVATDSPQIVAAVNSFGGQAVLTRADHPCGTDRVAEVARKYPADIVVNLQGDEPLVEPAALDRVIELLHNEPTARMATLATPIRSLAAWNNPACVKVVVDDSGNALYFSRSCIPYVRDGQPDLNADPPMALQHVGLYAYRRDSLLAFAATPPGRLEQLEKLEQLRALSLGWRIQVGLIAEPTIGVDTPEDYERFVTLYQQLHLSTRAA